jgi:hypothetical protein
VPDIDVIQVRVELHDVERRLVVKGANARVIDRVIAAQHDGKGMRRQNLAHREFDVGVTALSIGMNHVRIANVDHLHLVRGHVDHVILVIVGTVMSE